MPGIITTTTTEPTPERDSPAVLAYRVGELEKAVTVGLENLGKKFDDLRHEFATKAEIETLKRESGVEHKSIRSIISAVDERIDKLDKKRWVQNTLSSILGAILTLLLAFFITNVGK